MKHEQLEQSAIACIAGMQALIASKPCSPEYHELLKKLLAANEEYEAELVKIRFAEMANKYQKEKAAGTPPHLIEP